MPITSNFRAADGTLVVPSDARGNTVLYLSRDEGATWRKPEGVIAGIHAGVVQLRDGRLLAIGRGHNIAGRMPISLSSDMGKTWTVCASPFSSISSGQRIALTRLQSGAILLASFCGDTTTFDDSRRLPRNNGDPIEVIDAAGVKRKINGLFVALSFDDGKTWPTRRLVTAGGPPRQLDLTYGTRFVMDENHGEPQGYLAVCQTANGLIHLITSQREYIFNMAWLKTPMPAAQRASLVPSRGRMLAGNPAPAPDRL